MYQSFCIKLYKVVLHNIILSITEVIPANMFCILAASLKPKNVQENSVQVSKGADLQVL